MTLEIIVFTLAILLGIVIYWRESKSNRIYRFFNTVMHSKELQMKPENRKGFVHRQPFLMRLVWITLVFVIAGAIISFATPVNVFVQYFVSAIVGTLIGTYSLFFFTSEGLKAENIKKNMKDAYNKGRDFVEDITEEDTPESAPEPTEKTETEDRPSARERLKNKGMIK